MTYQSNPQRSGFRELGPQELEAVSGGVVSFRDGTAQTHNNKNHRDDPFKGSDAVGYYDIDGDGRLSDGDTIVYYEKNGVKHDPDAWEIESAVQEWLNSKQHFQDLGAGLDWIESNHWQAGGWILDNLDELFGSIKLTGSEYIDWKTGGAHRGVTSSNDLVNEEP
jgi:hypothetical protein